MALGLIERFVQDIGMGFRTTGGFCLEGKAASVPKVRQYSVASPDSTLNGESAHPPCRFKARTGLPHLAGKRPAFATNQAPSWFHHERKAWHCARLSLFLHLSFPGRLRQGREFFDSHPRCSHSVCMERPFQVATKLHYNVNKPRKMRRLATTQANGHGRRW